MQDKLKKFIDHYIGVPDVGNTKDNKGECVGLVMVWLVEALGQPHIWGHAKDLLTNASREHYDVILNTPNNFPQPGDVVVYNKNYNGTFGHTGIVINANASNFDIFEQNNPLGGLSKTRNSTYKYVDGWVHPKKTGGGTMANMYKGYDLGNPDSMKIAVDVLVRVQQGEFVDKAKYEKDLAAAKASGGSNANYDKLREALKEAIK